MLKEIKMRLFISGQLIWTAVLVLFGGEEKMLRKGIYILFERKRD